MNHKSALAKAKRLAATDSKFKSIAPIITDRRNRATAYHQKTNEAVAEFMQMDFKAQIAKYNKMVEAVNKAVYRLKKSGADVSAFTDLTAAPELMTASGERFAKFGKNILAKYENAGEGAQKRAEDYLLKDYVKLKTISEGVGKTEYNKRVAEKAQIEQALGLDKPITWRQYAATKVIKEQITTEDYYALIQYAEEVGYIPDLSADSVPKIKVKDYEKFLVKLNAWVIDQEGKLPTGAVTSLKDLKRKAIQDAIDRPRHYTAKYGDVNQRRIIGKRGSAKLGL